MSMLWLSRYAPYPPMQGGDTEYSRELAHSLARRTTVRGLGFAMEGVTVPVDAPMTWQTVPYRRASKLRGLLSPLPDVAFRFQQQAYLAEALALAADSEAIFVDFIGMAWIVPPLRAHLRRLQRNTPIIMITHNHEGAMRAMIARDSRFPKRLVLARDAAKADRLERTANDLADGISAITPEDAAAFRTQGDTPVETIWPGYAGPRRAERTIDAMVPPVAAIIGNRTSAHKITVLDHALAALSAAGADRRVRIEVAGAGNLARIGEGYPNVALRGFVENMPAYLDGVRIGLIPDDLGGGFKMRSLTLGFLRVPILGLRSAMRGTGFVPDEHFVAVDTLDELAAMLPHLIEDLPRLNAVQEAAYRHCSMHYDWDGQGERLLTFARTLIAGQGNA